MQEQKSTRRSLAEQSSKGMIEPSIQGFSANGKDRPNTAYSFLLGLPDCFRGKASLCGHAVTLLHPLSSSPFSSPKADVPFLTRLQVIREVYGM
jgi:hypothetical protein